MHRLHRSGAVIAAIALRFCFRCRPSTLLDHFPAIDRLHWIDRSGLTGESWTEVDIILGRNGNFRVRLLGEFLEDLCKMFVRFL